MFKYWSNIKSRWRQIKLRNWIFFNWVLKVYLKLIKVSIKVSKVVLFIAHTLKIIHLVLFDFELGKMFVDHETFSVSVTVSHIQRVCNSLTHTFVQRYKYNIKQSIANGYFNMDMYIAYVWKPKTNFGKTDKNTENRYRLKNRYRVTDPTLVYGVVSESKIFCSPNAEWKRQKSCLKKAALYKGSIDIYFLILCRK